MVEGVIKMIEDLDYFNPLRDNPKILPETSGFYIMCLNKGSILPSILKDAHFSIYKNLRVLYVGITTAKKGIRGRDYRNHFNGNAGGSTLRKSLGVLFNYKLIPRDKEVTNNKKKFSKEDESKLSIWMKNNLTFFYKIFEDPDSIEQELIDLFNPPINLGKTKHILVNQEIRREISFLRSKDSPLIIKSL
jgi:hypothetical protein